jgi:hypothetical protein
VFRMGPGMLRSKRSLMRQINIRHRNPQSANLYPQLPKLHSLMQPNKMKAPRLSSPPRPTTETALLVVAIFLLRQPLPPRSATRHSPLRHRMM